MLNCLTPTQNMSGLFPSRAEPWASALGYELSQQNIVVVFYRHIQLIS